MRADPSGPAQMVVGLGDPAGLGRGSGKSAPRASQRPPDAVALCGGLYHIRGRGWRSPRVGLGLNWTMPVRAEAYPASV